MSKYTIINLLCFATIGIAQTAYCEDNHTINSVAETKTMEDGSYVNMQGYIVEKLEDESYNFQDSTGNILLIINDEDWNADSITSKDLVEVQGEVRNGWTDVEVKADMISKYAPKVKKQLSQK